MNAVGGNDIIRWCDVQAKYSISIRITVWEYTVIFGYIDFIIVFQNAENPNPFHYIKLE
jgi:hypothetical protein